MKISDETIAAWREVLNLVAGSRLMVLSPVPNPHLVERFERQGVDRGRLELVGRCSREEYLRLFDRIDIALDPFPYNGDTTTCDGLWMGVPMVTLAGDAFVSRRGVSHLCNVGLGELVAQTTDEYVRLAAGLASDVRRLAKLRSGLREMMRRSPIMSFATYTANWRPRIARCGGRGVEICVQSEPTLETRQSYEGGGIGKMSRANAAVPHSDEAISRYTESGAPGVFRGSSGRVKGPGTADHSGR